MDNKRKFNSENFENKRQTTYKNGLSRSSSIPIEDVVSKYIRICGDINGRNTDALGRWTEQDLWTLNKYCYLYNLPSPIIISIENGISCASSLLIELVENTGLSVFLKDEDGDDFDDTVFYCKIQNRIFSKSMDLACELNQITIVKLLFQKDVTSYFDSAWLSTATRKENIDIIKFILQSTEVHQLLDCSDAAAIAIEGGHLDIFMLYYDFVEYLVCELLPMAVKYGHMNIIEFILNKQKMDHLYYDSSAINEALVTAASLGRRDIIDLLLDEGANRMLTPYVEAVVNGHIELSKYLLSLLKSSILSGNKNKDDILKMKNALAKVASVGNVEVLQILFDILFILCNNVKYNYNDTKNSCIWFAMVSAAEFGHLDAVVFLLSHDKQYLNSSLLKAASNGHDAVIQQLLTAGAIVDMSALRSASQNGHLSTVQLLLTYVQGNHIQIPYDFETIVYHMMSSAIMEGQILIVKYLIDTGAVRINYEILVKAIDDNQIDMFQFLLNLKQSATTTAAVTIAATTTTTAVAANTAAATTITTTATIITTAAAVSDDLNDLMLRAACTGNLTFVQILLEKGVICYNAALICAWDHDQWELIKPLVTAGATLLNDALIAISNRDVPYDDNTTGEIIKDIIDIAKFLIHQGATNLNVALSHASTSHNLDLVKVLVEAGADAFDSALYSLHSTPDVFRIGRGGYHVLKISKYLLSKSSNPFVLIDGVNSALTLSNDDGNARCIRLFLASEWNSSCYESMVKRCFIVSAKRGFSDCIQLYLDHGLDVNQVYHNQLIPLICAVETANREFCFKATQLLLEKGADVNAQTKLGKTALIAAIKTKKSIALIELLVEKGAYLELKDYDQKTAMFWAAITKCSDQIEKVQYLLERGADGRDLGSKKAQDKSLEDLISNSRVLELIKTFNDAKPLYYCK